MKVLDQFVRINISKMLFVVFLFQGLACMPLRNSSSDSVEAGMNPSGKTLTAWFVGEGLAEDEERTVMEIRAAVEYMGGPDRGSSASSAATWAEYNLDTLTLSSANSLSIKPILALKNLRVLDIQGSSLTQAQVDELLPQLSKLRTFVPSSEINCPQIARINCIKDVK